MKRFISTLLLSLITVLSFGQTTTFRFNLEKYLPMYESSIIESKGDYRDGKKHGNWVYYFTSMDNQKYKSGSYIDGKKDGVWKYYYEGISVADQTNDYAIRSIESYKDGLLLEYLGSTQNLKIEFPLGLDKENAKEFNRICEGLEFLSLDYYRKHGEDQFRIEKAAVELIGEVIKSAKTDANIFHYYNDSIQDAIYYKDGMQKKRIYYTYKGRTLLNKKVYKNENLEYKIVFVEGNRENQNIYTYYDNGNTKSYKEIRKSTQPNGIWTSYYEDGKTKSSQKYSNGLKHGWYKEYDSQGKLKNKIKYKKGLVKK
ncbi:MAG: hypothetical protein ACEPOV_03785 [Hyphomicrobiales bacterium]